MKLNVYSPRNRIFIIGRSLLLCAALLMPIVSAGEVEAAHPISSGDALAPLAPEVDRLVENLDDSGPGSLREALDNAAPGDRIIFHEDFFPPETPGTISILSELPHIWVDGLTIDAVGRGVILDGSSMPPESIGLFLHADHTIIQGLQVQGFSLYGISLEGATNCLIGGDRLAGEGNVISGNSGRGIRLDGPTTSNNIIAGNIVGADPSGMAALPNGQEGILIWFGAHHNTIGGLLPGYGNLISGNGGSGIVVMGNGTDYNVIQGNLIGTDLTGDGTLGNGRGIEISEGSNDTLVGGDTVAARNVIASNHSAGIRISGISTDDTLVRGNYIGLNSSGTQPLPNNYGGVAILAGAKRTVVGGNTPEQRNIISGNRTEGVFIQDSYTTGTMIQGNYIGTDPTGTMAIPNQSHGVEVRWAADSLIGGAGTLEACTGACNLISGNQGAGIVAGGPGTTGNIIQGNFVGSDLNGELALGNGQEGVRIDIYATGNQVGGELSGSGNLIRFNREGGVTLASTSATNLLTGNRIDDNHGVAIRYQPGNTLGVNTCSGNELNLVEVNADALASGGEEWRPQGDLTRYVVVAAGQGSLRVPTGATWTVGAGVEVLFDFGQDAVIEGVLEAQGTATQPVVFGSAQRYAAPLPGDWQGLSFKPGSSGSLEHTAVEFAQTGLTLNSADVSVSDSTVTASQLDGISAGTGSNLTLKSNTLAGNGRYALNNQTSASVDASDTWWGHASGPDGLGDGSGWFGRHSKW